MNVFVLCTGRCASTTFTRACQHMTNFTAGHETRARMLGTERFAYLPNHIEVDNRLSWMLGRLAAATESRDVRYVHLVRDAEATARSYCARFDRGIMRAYSEGVLMHPHHTDPLDICRDYVETVNANIVRFLEDKNPDHVMTVRVESAQEDFTQFWNWIGAEGNLGQALHQWDQRYNVTRPTTLVGTIVRRFGTGVGAVKRPLRGWRRSMGRAPASFTELDQK
jgi:hypothetical protein